MFIPRAAFGGALRLAWFELFLKFSGGKFMNSHHWSTAPPPPPPLLDYEEEEEVETEEAEEEEEEEEELPLLAARELGLFRSTLGLAIRSAVSSASCCCRCCLRFLVP